MFKRLHLLLLSLMACLCASAHADTFHIAVASNFNKTLQALVQQFEQSHDHRVVISPGSSGKLFAQIQHGAPFDIFLSADREKPEALERAGLSEPGMRFTYALGTLALWAPHMDPAEDGPTLLQSGRIQRLALANPRLAPYGSATIDVLNHFMLTDDTRKTWVLGENIAQTYQFIASGAADAGFVALTQLIDGQVNTQGTVWRVPSSLHRPIKQQALLLRRGSAKRGARDFWQFLQSDQARYIIRDHGYTVEP